MKIESTEVYGFGAAIRGMRNPINSWAKSDSVSNSDQYHSDGCHSSYEEFSLRPADKILSQKLTKAGTEHAKHLRFITVWFDIIAPRFWYQQFDTYKHKENVSCSTMHTFMKKHVSYDDFEWVNGIGTSNSAIPGVLETTISSINQLIDQYQATSSSDIASTKEEQNWLLQYCKSLLPESFLQRRTVCTNYQALYSMYQQRRHHRLPQWQYFCNWIEQLPYFIELTGIEKKGDC